MRMRIILITVVSSVLLAPVAAQGQMSILKRMDTDGDGIIEPAKLPKLYRRIFDRMAKKYKLDKKEKVKLTEIAEAMELSAQASLASKGPAPREGRTAPKRFSPPSHHGEMHPLVPLPRKYASYDKNSDGQIGLYEWPRDRIPEFLKLDKNDDGFLTIKEIGSKEESEGEEGQKEAKKEEQPKESSSPG